MIDLTYIREQAAKPWWKFPRLRIHLRLLAGEYETQTEWLRRSITARGILEAKVEALQAELKEEHERHTIARNGVGKLLQFVAATHRLPTPPDLTTARGVLENGHRRAS